MKFIKQTFSYITSNFIYLFLMALVPSVFIGILCKPFKIFEFLRSYSSTPITSFGSLFTGLCQFTWLDVILSVIALLILVVFISAVLGFIENHMRSGKRSIKSLRNYINNNLLSVSANLLIACVVYFVLIFILSSLLFLLHIVISGINSSPLVINFIIAILFIIIVFLLMLFFIICMMLNIVNMNQNGYPVKDGFASTIKLISKNFASVLLAFSLPFIILIPLVIITCGTAWLYVVGIVGILILCVYYPALSSVIYFDVTGTSRYDNRKYYNINYEK